MIACGGDPATTTGTDSDAGTDTQATTTTTAGPTSGETDTLTGGPTTDVPTSTTAPTSTTTPTSTTSESTSTSTDTTTGDTTTGGAAEGGLSQRPADPVVLLGGQLPGLAGVAAGDVVGFVHQDGAWKQIPIQVDERVLIDFCTIYAEELLGNNAPCGTAQTINALFYADPNTYTGPDSDPNLDSDDEVVFMARDAGDRTIPGDAPVGVVAGSGVEVELVDGDERGWVYLFAREVIDLEPGADVDLVAYDLVFAGDIDYKTEYPFIGDGSCGNMVCDPPILEDSKVTSAHYERHFSARWVTDSLKITWPESTGQDILDIAQARFAPNVCGRHVLTFSTAEGAFVANIDGPVRAIRSYLGANSGPLTQRTHLFYDRLEVVQTFLRVHPIGGIMELVDYAADAPGMTYYNEHNEGGLTIDGVPDAGFDDAAFAWELVSGPHGSVVSVLDPNLSQSLSTIAYYEDDSDTPNNQCSASNVLDHPDDVAFGTSGTWINTGIPGTDPRSGDVDHVFIQRTSLYEPPDLSVDGAKQLVARIQGPLQALARTFGDALGEACGDASCDAGEDATCPYDCVPFAGTCGDQLCDLWENSVSCPADCDGEGMMGPGCGDATCDNGEHELSCAADCWSGTFEPLVACMDQSCGAQKGACSDEAPCVDRIVCVAECVAGGGVLGQCAATCTMQIPATAEQAAFAMALMACTQQNCL